MQEQRTSTRRLLQVRAMVADADADASRWSVVDLLDISRMGVAFASDAPMSAGNSCLLRFKFPDQSELNEVVLTIVHSAQAGAGTGIRVGARFAVIDPACLARIAAFIAAP